MAGSDRKTERGKLDRQMVDAIREVLGLAPLYATEDAELEHRREYDRARRERLRGTG